MDLTKLNVTQLATITGIDRRTVKDRLTDMEPVGFHAKSNLYDPKLALPILLGMGEVSDAQMSRKLAEETLRLEKARADKTTIEVQKLRGEVVDASEVAKVVAAEYTNVRARLMSIGSRVAKDLANEITAPEAKDIVDREINEALAELSADTQYEEITNDGSAFDRPVETDTPKNPQATSKA